MIDVRHLRQFLAIASAPSISVASQQIGVAQPSLSQLVQRMEEELGVKLLERSPRGTFVTEEGAVLLVHAKRICGDLDKSIQDMKDLAGTVRGTVSFGMPPSASIVMSVPLAETVRLELPDVRLKVVETNSGYIAPMLEDGTVDIGIIYEHEMADKLNTTHILDEELHFYSAPDAWPFKTPPTEPISFKELSTVEMVLPSNGLRNTIRRYEIEHDVDLNVVIEMDAMRQIMELVARGSGYTIFSPSATQHFVTRGELLQVPIINPIMIRPVHLINHSGRVKTRACQTVETMTLTIARELVERGLWEGQLV